MRIFKIGYAKLAGQRLTEKNGREHVFINHDYL